MDRMVSVIDQKLEIWSGGSKIGSLGVTSAAPNALPR